jgi:putative copper export protein
MFLAPHWAAINLWLHVMAATVWIGGQITLGLLVPLLRRDRDLLIASARRFQVGAWVAFAVLVITGIINMHNAGMGIADLNATPAGRTLSLKLGFVLLSGVAAAVHAYVVGPRIRRSPTTTLRALSGVLGALALLAAVVAALYGVIIAEA